MKLFKKNKNKEAGSPVKEAGKPPYSDFLEKKEIKSRQCVYISRDVHERVADVVRTLTGNKVSIGGYIDKVLADHLERYADEIRTRYEETLISRFR